MEAAKISMIALDLDGTCLDSTGKMVDRTRNILEYYGEKGTQIVFRQAYRRNFKRIENDFGNKLCNSTKRRHGL